MRAGDYQEQMILGWREDQLQRHVLLLAKALGWISYHTHDSRRSDPGFPDLALAHPVQRRVMFRELKTQRGKYRPMQREWLEMMNQAGLDAGTWRPADVVSGRIERELRSRA